jgi:hypothetical protein
MCSLYFLAIVTLAPRETAAGHRVPAEIAASYVPLSKARIVSRFRPGVELAEHFVHGVVHVHLRPLYFWVGTALLGTAARLAQLH